MFVSVSDAQDTLYLTYDQRAGYWGQRNGDILITKITDGDLEQYRAEGLAINPPDVPGSYFGSLINFAVSGFTPSRFYALIANEYSDDLFALFQALWVSADSGRNWERLGPPVTEGCVYPELQIDPSDTSVYVACGNDLLKSMDGGASWTPKAFPNGERLWNLRFERGTPTAVLYGDQRGLLWKSTDGAETWQLQGPEDVVKAVAIMKAAARAEESLNFWQWAWYWQRSSAFPGAPAGFGVLGSIDNNSGMIDRIVAAGGGDGFRIVSAERWVQYYLQVALCAGCWDY